MEDQYKWYAVRILSGKERKIKDYIESEVDRLGLSKYVKQVLIPTEKVFQMRNGKKITKERNFFPGYILIEAALVGEVEHAIKNVNGIIGFLGNKDIPEPLRQSEINRILGKVDELAEQGELPTVPFVIGEAIKVTDGPFNNFSGIIEEIHEEKKKLKVMVKIFGRRTPLELNYMQVEKES
ncbi:MAG: transcription termination/antitermination factor NusG [Bacteroidetes bacterium]|nr:MAG: transcription termination/antitermination factor NusG [Bacteroidota bacterium]